jgi:hypothetical protein
MRLSIVGMTIAGGLLWGAAILFVGNRNKLGYSVAMLKSTHRDDEFNILDYRSV